MNKETLKSYAQIGLSYLFKIFPVKAKRIYFCSFHGQYSDSPRRVSEMLHEKLNNLELIWEISDKCKELPPDYVRKVEPRTIKALYYRSTSRVVVENYMGWSYGYSVPGSFQYKLLSHQKKKGQFDICTWHGTALKRIGIDQPNNSGKDLIFYTTADLLSANCDFMKNLYNHINQDKIPITMSGTPRNDILFDKDEEKKKALRRKLNLPEDKKLILFAPTFRAGDLQMSGLYQVEKLNIPILLDTLSSKFGGEWKFVFRAHDSVLKRMEDRVNQYSADILPGNIGDDMGEYMVACDVLLTDYSSSFFDFMFTGNPCFLYCPDYEHYGQVERGFYFKPEELPYPMVITEDELYLEILRYDLLESKNKVSQFLNRIGNVEDGKSTEKIVRIIMDKLKLPSVDQGEM